MMNKLTTTLIILLGLAGVISCANSEKSQDKTVVEKPRVVVLTDAEIDDQCSMVRFMLYANEFDVEAIITTSSQYHSHGYRWAGDDWLNKYLDAYAEVFPNLRKHDHNYPTPEYLRAHSLLGNVESEGEMDSITPGSQKIAELLLDQSDNRPIWMEAWGGTNTLARALKTIEEEHPDRMAEVSKKLRFFFIWEQDSTYQAYIRPHWGKYNIPTIISDQFEAIAYRWKNIQPEKMQKYFEAAWMNEHILQNHGPLCSLYEAHTGDKEGFDKGDFRSEGDSPAFMHEIPTGLRSTESPEWGGWGGRYVLVRENTWLDPVPVEGYEYPEGRWYGDSGWGRMSEKAGLTSTTSEAFKAYFKPIWRWSDAFQNDFAARAEWCVKSYEDANHTPVVKLANALDMTAKPGSKIRLSATGTMDPDGDQLSYKWWQYEEADTYKGAIEIQNADQQEASFIVPKDAPGGETIHVICEVKDDGSPQLTRYQRVVVTVE